MAQEKLDDKCLWKGNEELLDDEVREQECGVCDGYNFKCKDYFSTPLLINEFRRENEPAN